VSEQARDIAAGGGAHPSGVATGLRVPVTAIAVAVIGLAATVSLQCRSSSTADAPAAMRAPVEAVAPTAAPGIELPEVPAIGFDPADKLVPVIAVSRTALSVEGTQLVAMKDGQLDPSELTRGAAGVVIVALRDALIDRPAGKDARLVLAVDRQISSRLLAQVVYTAHAARPGVPVLLLARAGARQVAAPVYAPAPTADSSDPVGLVVSVGDAELRVWSTTGTEGTRGEPKAVIALAAPDPDGRLAAALAEIATRRYGDAMRAPGTTRVTIEAAPEVPVQAVAAAVAAVRRTADGAELFPDVVVISMGA
jgi:hypothetical protein